MRTDEFDYHLPPEAIAQKPLAQRDASRLLVDRSLDPGDLTVDHHLTSDLPDLLKPGDLVVVNDTRVLPARLRLRKRTGGAVEILALEPLPAARGDFAGADTWLALVKPGRRVPDGTVLVDEAGREVLVVAGTGPDGQRVVHPMGAIAMIDLLSRRGEVPLPPYIEGGIDDPERYQTVFADEATSVAAPTAGLHLTQAVLDGLAANGVDVARVSLSVGVATFRPIEVDDVESHTMHTERFAVPTETWEACQRAERVVAIGTTTVRTLESVAATGKLSGATDLYIRPGHRFRIVDVLMTNFHMPRSSLLVLLAAFVGDRWRDLYDVALGDGYRFLSFGDAMLVENAAGRRGEGSANPAASTAAGAGDVAQTGIGDVPVEFRPR